TLSDGYLVLSRLWKNNDVVTVYLEAELYAERMPDNPHRKASFYGPTLLAGNLGKTEPDPMQGIPVLVSDSNDPHAIIKPFEPDSMKFKTVGVGQPMDVVLQPFNRIDDEYYTVYWDVFTKDAWRAEQKRYEESKQANYELEKSTVDYLRVGEMQPERDHNFTGENLEYGESHTRKFRVANNGGHFSFTMKVVPGFSYNLIATYWGMDNRGRNFDIIVEGETIASEDLNKYKQSKFYDISYRIPSKVIEGKNTINITFKAKSHNQAGPVYGIRVVKESK